MKNYGCYVGKHDDGEDVVEHEVHSVPFVASDRLHGNSELPVPLHKEFEQSHECIKLTLKMCVG